MSTIGPTLPPQQITPAYSPLGKPAVGLENPEAKDQTLPPVEESTQAEKNRNQLAGKKTDAVTADAERRQGRPDREPSEQLGDGEVENMQAAATERQVRAPGGGNAAAAPGFRFIAKADGQQYVVGDVPIELTAVPPDSQATARSPQAQTAGQAVAEAPLQLTAQRAAVLAHNAGDKPGGADAAGAFKAAADDDPTPGSLLDQRV